VALTDGVFGKTVAKTERLLDCAWLTQHSDRDIADAKLIGQYSTAIATKSVSVEVTTLKYGTLINCLNTTRFCGISISISEDICRWKVEKFRWMECTVHLLLRISNMEHINCLNTTQFCGIGISISEDIYFLNTTTTWSFLKAIVLLWITSQCVTKRSRLVTECL